MIMTESQAPECGLQWCMNPSFEDYVLHAAAEGKVEAHEGARPVEEATYFFPALTPKGNTSAFRGRVSYTAYFGLLDVQIDSPRLVTDGDAMRLLVRNQESPNENWAEFGHAPTFAVLSGDKIPITLGSFGAELFMNKYPTGSTLGHIRVNGVAQRKES